MWSGEMDEKTTIGNSLSLFVIDLEIQARNTEDCGLLALYYFDNHLQVCCLTTVRLELGWNQIWDSAEHGEQFIRLRSAHQI